MKLKHTGKMSLYEAGYKLWPEKRDYIKKRVKEFNVKKPDPHLKKTVDDFEKEMDELNKVFSDLDENKQGEILNKAVDGAMESQQKMMDI